MAVTVIKNIKRLVGTHDPRQRLQGPEMSQLPSIENAYLVMEDDLIAGFGKMNDMPAEFHGVTSVVDATDRFMLPCWCDSHTHMVFAAAREDEFLDKIKGLSYAQIAAR